MVRAIDALTRSEASVAVITPYRAQKLLITKKLGKLKENWTVMTVDASQGTMNIRCVSCLSKVCNLCYVLLACVCTSVRCVCNPTYVRTVHIHTCIPYGRKFWGGIYFGGLAVLRAIHQYFIRQTLHNVMSSLLQNHSLQLMCQSNRQHGVTIESCVQGHASPKSFVHQRKELACLSTR